MKPGSKKDYHQNLSSLEKALFTQLIPMLLVLTVFFFIVFQAIAIKYDYIHEVELINLEIERTAKELAEPLWNIDRSRIEWIADAVRSHEQVVTLKIFDSEGSLFLNAGIDPLVTSDGIPDISFSLIVSFIFRSFSRGLNYYYYTESKPIIYKSDMGLMEIGNVLFIISDNKILRQNRADFIGYALYSLFIIVVISAVIISINRRILLTPLQRLKNRILGASLQSSVIDKSNLNINLSNNEIHTIEMIFDLLWERVELLVTDLSDVSEYYRTLLETLPIGVTLTDLNGLIVDANEAYWQLVGATDKELKKSSVWEFWSDDLISPNQNNYDYLHETDSPHSRILELRTKDREKVIVSQREKIISRDNEKYVLSSYEDITETLSIKSELEKSKLFLQETASIAKIGGWEIKFETNELFWTDQVYEIHELPKDFIPTVNNTINFYHPDDAIVIEEAVAAAINEGLPFQVEARIITANSNEIWVQAIGKPIYEDGRIQYIRGTLQDISLRKKNEIRTLELERQVAHESKLDILGHLAGGVAHDFNNILAGIMNSSLLLSRKGNLDNKLQNYIDIIIQSSENGSRLANKLLTFSRKETDKQDSIYVNNLILDSIEILKTILDKKINISFSPSSEDFIIYADYSAMQNALLNLGINSSHAIDGQGDILITLSKCVYTADDCDHSLFDISPGDFVEISFADTGEGIPQNIIDKVFEPFFTTKESGRGTGLGLAAVKRSVIESKGEIRISSTLNVGTTIKMYIPLTNITLEPERNQEIYISEPDGTILFVDDEEINRLTSSDLLESLGYKIILASNGQEALDLLSRNLNLIDLVILDMIMPVMDGETAFRKMKELKPDIPIILCSGYSKSERVHALLEEGLDGIIAKPFNFNELTDAVRSFINKKINKSSVN